MIKTEKSKNSWNCKTRRNKVMSKNCPESAGATPSTAELEVLVNEITTGTSTKAASSRNRLRLFFRSFSLKCCLLSGICCGKWCWTRWEIKFTRNLVTLHNKAARFCKSDQIQSFTSTDLSPKKLNNWSQPINTSKYAMYPYFKT